MTRYLIDTNVISEALKQKPHGGVLAWLQRLEAGQAFFSAVTFGEIQRGVELTRRQDATKANDIESWATQLEKASQVLPMDVACFREYARLMQGRLEMLAEDAMIAATAKVHGLTVATRDDFKHLGVAVVNPIKAGQAREWCKDIRSNARRKSAP